MIIKKPKHPADKRLGAGTTHGVIKVTLCRGVLYCLLQSRSRSRLLCSAHSMWVWVTACRLYKAAMRALQGTAVYTGQECSALGSFLGRRFGRSSGCQALADRTLSPLGGGDQIWGGGGWQHLPQWWRVCCLPYCRRTISWCSLRTSSGPVPLTAHPPPPREPPLVCMYSENGMVSL